MAISIIVGDCRAVLATLPAESVHCCVTSPPYFGLRDYGHAGQIGLEPTPDEFVAQLVAVFREVRRVLREDGTLWLNLGDSYNGSGAIGGKGKQQSNEGSAMRPDARAGYGCGLKQKDLIGVPWLVAFALRADGWYLRQEIIWHKPNPMPESVRDRCTKSHEHLFLLAKSKRYHFDSDAIAEPIAATTGPRIAQDTASQNGSSRAYGGEKVMRAVAPAIEGLRNKRSVWTVSTQPFSGAHFATFPPALIEPCILAGCPEGGTVLDPFGGAGTTGLVADRLQRDAVLVEVNPAYAAIARERIARDSPMFTGVSYG